MITENHRITFARCIDAGMSSALKIATIFKMVYDNTDAQAIVSFNASASVISYTILKTVAI